MLLAMGLRSFSLFFGRNFQLLRTGAQTEEIQNFNTKFFYKLETYFGTFCAMQSRTSSVVIYGDVVNMLEHDEICRHKRLFTAVDVNNYHNCV